MVSDSSLLINSSGVNCLGRAVIPNARLPRHRVRETLYRMGLHYYIVGAPGTPHSIGGDPWLSWSLRCAVPRQQGLKVFCAQSFWQALKAVGLDRLDQTVKLSIGRLAFGRVAEQSVLRPITKGLIARSAALVSIGKKPASV